MTKLEDVLKELSRFGRVWLFMSDDKWISKIEVNMTIAGASFEIHCDRNHTTPLDAVLQVRNRLLDALVSFDGKAIKVGK